MKRLILENGRIMGTYEQTCVVIEGDRLVEIGVDEICDKYRNGAQVIDVEGKVILPGLIDAHLHLENLAYMYEWIDLRGVKSIEEIRDALRIHAKKINGWILGRGWDHELFREKRIPTRQDLDEAVQDKPVLIIRVCGHVAVANSKALEITGLLNKIPKQYEHLIDIDNSGKPTGVLYEDAILLVKNKIPKPNTEELSNKLEKAMYKLLSHGITMVNSMAASIEEYEALKNILNNKARLPIRVRLFLSENALTKVPLSELDQYRSNPWLSIRGLKVFADGSFGARTAALKEDYSDDPGNKGKLLLNSRQIAELAKETAAKGLYLAVHAIGDRAIEEVARGILEVNADNVRIEHASLTPPETLELLANAKPYAVVVQPHFTVSDWWIKDRLGDRARYVYAFKTLMSRGLILAGSSDAPVEPVNPWLSIAAFVTRGNLKDINSWEVLDIGNTIQAYTTGSAKASGDYGQIGLIKRDYYADLIVVDENPWTLDGNDIAGIRPLMVIVGGKIAYELRDP